jgi:hypothetical protein
MSKPRTTPNSRVSDGPMANAPPTSPCQGLNLQLPWHVAIFCRFNRVFLKFNWLSISVAAEGPRYMSGQADDYCVIRTTSVAPLDLRTLLLNNSANLSAPPYTT